MDYRHIIYQPGKVSRIILNRPKILNAQSFLTLDEMDSAFSAAVKDPACGAIVLSGAGRAFSVGHDIGTEEDQAYKEQQGYATFSGLDLSGLFEDMKKLYVHHTLAWRNLQKPTIAMVHGYCIFGGWMVASAMDIIFAAEDALFLPGFVEYFCTPWDMGLCRAKEILLEHRFITTKEAYHYGFLNRIFPSDKLEEETLSFADRIADNYLANPIWAKLCKLSINHMEDAKGFTAEIEASYNNFCLMLSTLMKMPAQPDEGGFARTKVARKNFELSKPWLRKAGLE